MPFSPVYHPKLPGWIRPGTDNAAKFAIQSAVDYYLTIQLAKFSETNKS
jgi:hypothetical protein